VRTPMQWSADRNAGFSRANPAKLYSPLLIDPVFGYEVINVESQQGDASSLLTWTKHMIALRKIFHVFGRGTIEFLEPANRKILAYVREYERERVLCVANLSRFAQPVELELSAFAGTTPVEMLGYVEFPRIGRSPYQMTIGPYGVFWFELHGEPEPLVDPSKAEPVVKLASSLPWSAPFEPERQALLDASKPASFLMRQRWFGGKSRRIAQVVADDWVPVSDLAGFALLRVEYADGGRETYVVLLTFSTGAAAERLRADHPNAILCAITSGGQSGVVHDALISDVRSREVLATIVRQESRRGVGGRLLGVRGAGAEADDGERIDRWAVIRASGEQSNSSIIFGDRYIMKVFRRLDYGPNPDCEMTRYLSEVQHFDGVPAYAGQLEYRRPEAGTATLGFVQRLVPNQGDGWPWMLDELGRYYEYVLTLPTEELLAFGQNATMVELAELELPPELDDALGLSDDAAAALGRRTAQMHLALAAHTDDPAFAPEPFTADDLRQVVSRLRDQATDAFARLRELVSTLPDEVVEIASQVLGMRTRMLARVELLGTRAPQGEKIRVHGDYHLGQVLRAETDFVIIDFEGEPSRPIAQRRQKQSALKDVAGMLRSFSYAARFAFMTRVARRIGGEDRLLPWSLLWERSVHAAFLGAYRRTTAGASFLPAGTSEFADLLDVFLLEKLMYELGYELGNRPAWVGVPLAGIIDLDQPRRSVTPPRD
jgi:maltose alpha-D-glucosyltransferase/alpha-amylase